MWNTPDSGNAEDITIVLVHVKMNGGACFTEVSSSASGWSRKCRVHRTVLRELGTSGIILRQNNRLVNTEEACDLASGIYSLRPLFHAVSPPAAVCPASFLQQPTSTETCLGAMFLHPMLVRRSLRGQRQARKGLPR